MPKSGLGRMQERERDKGRSQMSPALGFFCGCNDLPGQQQLQGGRLSFGSQLSALASQGEGKSGRQECEVADPVLSEAVKAEGWHSAGFLCSRKS